MDDTTHSIVDQLRSVQRGREANSKGAANEARAVELLTNMINDKLPWLVHVRGATDSEDHRGIDVVCLSAEDLELFVQVKSSQTGIDHFRETYATGHRGVLPIVLIEVNKRRSDESIVSELATGLGKLRRHILGLGQSRWHRWQGDMQFLHRQALQRESSMDPEGATWLAEQLLACVPQTDWLEDCRLMEKSDGLQAGAMINVVGTLTSLFVIVMKDRFHLVRLSAEIAETVFRRQLILCTLPKNPDKSWAKRLLERKLTPAYQRAQIWARQMREDLNDVPDVTQEIER